MALLIVVLPPTQSQYAVEALEVYGKMPTTQKKWNSAHDTLMSRREIVAYLKSHDVLGPLVRPGGALA